MLRLFIAFDWYVRNAESGELFLNLLNYASGRPSRDEVYNPKSKNVYLFKFWICFIASFFIYMNFNWSHDFTTAPFKFERTKFQRKIITFLKGYSFHMTALNLTYMAPHLKMIKCLNRKIILGHRRYVKLSHKNNKSANNNPRW